MKYHARISRHLLGDGGMAAFGSIDFFIQGLKHDLLQLLPRVRASRVLPSGFSEHHAGFIHFFEHSFQQRQLALEFYFLSSFRLSRHLLF
jgi:hypothetical protein